MDLRRTGPHGSCQGLVVELDVVDFVDVEEELGVTVSSEYENPEMG